MLFVYFNEKFARHFVHRFAHPGFMDDMLGKLAELKGRLRCITDLALALSAQHLSNRKARFNRMPTEYYVSSIANLRSMVDKGEIEGSEDWLLLMVVLGCRLEVGADHAF
jgi:hypothetical protein